MARRFHVVAADLRGYGDSVGPTDGGADHVKAPQAVIEAFERFFVWRSG